MDNAQESGVNMTQTTASLSPNKTHVLPRQIVSTLRKAIRRRRNVILMRGLLGVVAVALGALLAVMGIDAVVTIFSSTTRWLLTGAAVTATVAAFCWLVVRPLSRHMTLARIARLVEAHHPELEERISSAVELLTSSDAQDVLGSEALIAELTKEATEETSVVKPAREFTARSAVPYLAAFCCVAAVFGGLMIAWPAETSRLALRVVAPHARIGNLGARNLTVKPGDMVIATNESLHVTVDVENGGARSAKLLREIGEDETEMAMAQVDNVQAGVVTYKVSVPSGKTNFKYRVLVGEAALSRWYNVTVTPIPRVSRYDVTYDYPEYSGLRDGPAADNSGNIEALAGTMVTLKTTFNKKIKTAELFINGVPAGEGGVLTDVDRPAASWEIEMSRETSGGWSLKLVDEYGLENFIVGRRIMLIADAVPRVEVIKPQTTELKVKPTDQIRFTYEVREDFAIRSTELLVRTGDGQTKEIPIDLPTETRAGGGLWLGEATLDLALLELGLGVKHVRVQVRAGDNLPMPGGPQFGLSTTYTLIFDKAAESYVSQRVRAMEHQLAAGLKQALNELKVAKGRTVYLKQHLATAAPAPQPTDAAADKAHMHVVRADNILRTVAMAAMSDFVDAGTDALNIADEYLGPARKELEMIKLADSQREQLAHATSSDQDIGKAIAALEKVAGGLKEEALRLEKRLKLAAKAERLKEEFESVEEKRDAVAEVDQKDEILEQVLTGQKEVARETAELAAEVDKTKANPTGQEHKQAAQSTRKAADKLQSGETKDAMKAGKQAASQLDNLKKKLDKPAASGPPPAERKEMAEKADRLAKRQERLNKQMKAIDEGDLPKALDEIEKDVVKRTKELADDVAKLDKETKPESKTKENAEAAAKAADKAAEEAERQMADMGHDPRPGKVSPPKKVEGPDEPSDCPGGNPDGGQGTKGGGSNTGDGNSKGPSKSNNNINMTIGGKKNLGKATITPDSKFDNPSDKPGFGSGTIVEPGAEEALARAMELLQHPDSKGMGGLGGESDVASEGPKGVPEMPNGPAGDKPGMPGKAGKPGGMKSGGKGAVLSAGPGSVARLRALGLTADDWLSLPSSLREGIMDAADKEAPEEYRALVKQYFRALAQRGSGENGRGSR